MKIVILGALVQEGVFVTLLQCSYCNEFGGSISRWKLITLKVQYTTVNYNQ
jgi:hypothetical protein